LVFQLQAYAIRTSFQIKAYVVRIMSKEEVT